MAVNTHRVETARSARRSPERSLLDHVERVAPGRAGGCAVMFNLSRLRPDHRKPHHIRIASRTFDSLLNSSDAQLYVLSNGDLVIMCQDVEIDDLDPLVDKVRRLFRDDPVAQRTQQTTTDGFINWYHFEIDYNDFLTRVSAWSDDGTGGANGHRAAEAAAGFGIDGRALDPPGLAKITESVAGASLDELIRGQPAVIVGADGIERILFRECFISIGELQDRVAPGFNLGSNTWLFQHLIETIDRQMLPSLGRKIFDSLKDDIGINLTLDTVRSEEFQRFDKMVADHRGRIVVELQPIDIFSDINGYGLVRDWLRQRGYRVLVDGLNPLALRYYHPGDLEADYIKVVWGTEFAASESAETHAAIAEVIDGVGRHRFILASTASEDALRWALGLGIRRFQGDFIDTLVARQIDQQGGLAGAPTQNDRIDNPDAACHAALAPKQGSAEPLTPRLLGRVEQALRRTDVSNMVRRQLVCGVNGDAAPQPVFSELFIATSALRETMMPDVDLAASRWLFHYLTETLDRRMLAMLSKSNDRSINGDISVNLNVSTLLSPEFMQFDDRLIAARRGSIIVELQMNDIFSDLNAFLFARDFVKERGYRICIDGLTHQTIRFINRDKLGADMVKLRWREDLAETEDRDRICRMVKPMDESTVILYRCDDQSAVEFGQAIGVSMFQGRHIENLITDDNRRQKLATTRRRSPNIEFVEAGMKPAL